MQITVSRLAAAATVAVAIVACSGKSTPSNDNFAAAIRLKMASGNDHCLPAVSWPASSQPSDHGNPYAFYDAGVGYVHAGLATMKEEGPSAATSFRKRTVFSLSDEGKKALIRERYQPYPHQETGRFCYGKPQLTKVLRWDEPVAAGSSTTTMVYYEYELIDVPKWARADDLRAAYPVLASEVTGKGRGSMRLSLTDGGWQAIDQ